MLAAFSFMKEAMYRDLLTNEAAIIEHPVVAAIANQDPTSQDRRFLFEAVRPEDVDREAPAENTALVLDADSTQRACVAAALAGHSFVMDGPPGTGKSQTIANMIGALLHIGRSVLFVSEKAAALEVVRNRLAHVGLGSYVLELHSHKASRKEVAAQLAAALDTMPVPPPGLGFSERRLATEKRDALNNYAAAMNRIREPLGQTLHDVLGEISILNQVAAAPTPSAPGGDLSRQSCTEIADAAARLQRAWRPAVQGQSFLWREVIDRTPLDSRLYSAETALEELTSVASHNQTVRDAFAMHRLSQLSSLVHLLDLVGSRPPGIPDEWLTTTDVRGIVTSVDDLKSDLVHIEVRAQQANHSSGVPWTQLPDPSALPPQPAVSVTTPPPLSLGEFTAVEARELADRFESDAAMLEDRLAAVSTLTRAMHLPPIDTIQDLDNFLAIADLAFAPDRPERGWLTPAGLDAARHAAKTLRTKTSELASAETAAKRLYTDAALAEPLADLHGRFTNVHRGLRKLSGDYRRDKRAVAAFTVELVNLKDAIHDLGLAVSWSRAVNACNAEAAELSPSLGPYWRGRDTDFEVIDSALWVAAEVVRRTQPDHLPAVADFVTSVPDPALKALVDSTRESFDGWRRSLAPAPTHAARPELLLSPIATSISWLRAHLAPLTDTATIADAVSAGTGRTTTLAESLSILAARQGAFDAEARLVDNSARYEASLGDVLYAGTDTDTTLLDRAMRWARDVRRITSRHDEPLSPDQVKTLGSARLTEHLPRALDRWHQASATIVHAFDPVRHLELETELDDAASAASLIADLRSDDAGQEEWLAYTRARADLKAHGLTDVVRFCVDERIPVEDVVRVIQRATFRSFADAVIASDPHLQPARAEDRDALIEEFRVLDRQLIPAATSDIIRSVNSRRPAAVDVGEPALIRREGVKKTRHLPVRELIRKTRTTTMAIKPCFMMSPLSVSSYLPPDMRFDVVIFDEASQVTPGDAVNCIYRGNALITAGDDRQLPPTSFFDRTTDDDDEVESDVNDFQSILELAKASGGFRNLGLRWHYRSRHEALIAFSNHRFYDGNLITYPGAHSDGPDVGVELTHVPGVYRRGTHRDNPLEAQRVAERVIHHFDTRPDTSLGVVTFSVAQADAIQVALDQILDKRPDVALRLEGDRLNGFFIKSLESVQGDERDVMIFSIGYGPDEHKKVGTNFGALNKVKGWRRLNVAITRARQRVEIVTSLRAGDIPATPNESVRHLVGYLDYAERGVSALALDLGPTGLGPDSPFEESVIDVVRAMGFSVEPQVGAAGYRIDLGVRHPAHPGVFAIGIECDGYMYHSSPAARDRDRLRQQVLEGLGWRLHRIWGTAWYRHRDAEIQRLRFAIEAAINAPISGRLSGTKDPFERAEIEFAEIDRTAPPGWITPYTITEVDRLPRWTDPSDKGSRWDMVPAIEALARAEGPVHIDLVYQRLRDAWNIGRVGTRIQDNILAAIRIAEVTFADDFLDVPDRRETRVRVPTDGVGQRTAAQVPESEIGAAFVNLLADAGGTSIDDLFVSVARTFGWNRRGQDISNRLNSVLRQMIGGNQVRVENKTVTLIEVGRA